MGTFNISDIELLIFDLDGVLYTGSKPIDTAIEAIERYNKLGKKVTFFTNNSTLTRTAYVNKLNFMNVKSQVEQIYTSSVIAAGALSKEFSNKKAFVVGEEGLIDTLEEYDIHVINKDFDYEEIIKNNKIKVDFVIGGLDRTLTYNKLAAGSQLINRGAEFYATNDDATLPNDYGLLPGAGTIITALSTATGKKPLNIFGKPSPVGIDLILKDFKIDKRKAVMIGDRPDTDILCGKRANVKTLLVLTGIINKNNILTIDKNMQPDLIINDLSEF